MPYARALQAPTTHRHDYLAPYVADLGHGHRHGRDPRRRLRIGVDPLGGAGVHYWAPIAERYGLDLTVVNDVVDPTFALHDRGLGRQDPHGLLVALRHGSA